ncbi:MAG: hypothetical protein M3P18_06835 [Actinomycetota bacterium]|nr:hypothetical protein [Actinomycetota bacterium]
MALNDQRSRDAAKRRTNLNRRLRAEEEWRNRTGRPMTAEELERVLRRYPRDG